MAVDPSRQQRSAPADEELIPRLCQGDAEAYVLFVRRYHGRLMRLARSFVASQASAEEVVQETWLAVLQGIERFEHRSSVKAWLFRILINRAKTRGQREGRTRLFADLTIELPQEPDELLAQFAPNGHWLSPPAEWDHSTPETQLMSQETTRVLEQAVRDLPPTPRAVILLRDIEGLDAEEVCQQLSLSEANQRVILHRARTAIRLAITKHMQKS